MIASFGVLLLAMLLGCAAMWWTLADSQPGWPKFALVIGAGTAFGLGATSILFFLAKLVSPRFALAELAIETAALAWLIFQIRNQNNQAQSEPAKSHSILLPAAALAIVLALGTGGMSKSWDQNPQGQWDAWSIWNLRAKLIDTPDSAARAWSPLLKETHPEYPLLVSGAVARAWSAGNAAPESIPIAIGYLFFLSLVLAVTGGIAIARGPLTGLAAGLTLATTGALLHEVPSQYADVPLAACAACSLVFLLMDRSVWAGVFAGFAAWTKDEGALFCVVLVVMIAIFERRAIARTLVGILPGAAVYGMFKLFLAPHVTSQFGPGSLARFADGGRWSVVLGSVATQIVSLGAGWFHPAFILAAFAIGAGALAIRETAERPRILLASGISISMLAGYCIVMVTASADVVWQTNTAAGRLVVQWWPLAVIAGCFWLCEPQPIPVEISAPRVKKRK